MTISPAIQTDYYKVNHHEMYPQGTTKIYSNLTARKSRVEGVDGIVVFGIQYFILEYLIKQWNDNFFNHKWYNSHENLTQREADENHFKKETISKYKRMMDYTLGKDSVDTKHLEDLWDLGYMPLEIKALPEGTICPIGVPCLTITNTVDHAYWLVNYLETILSCTVWQPITSATLAHNFKKLLSEHSIKTTGSTEGVQWQGHDFSMRGMSSLESACTSGAGHLLSFTGTDTIPAISFLEEYYDANIEKELVGASVPATEHSVMCMGGKDGEIETFERLLDLYPEGVLSVVSDTWDLWQVLTEFLPKLKEKILARNGTLVIRPDSGDPSDIICGTGWNTGDYTEFKAVAENSGFGIKSSEQEYKGVIELLWDVFGGIVNEQGYKVLDPHIGAIYGDSIDYKRAEDILTRLEAKGFASCNIIFGVGSYTYQHNTRDTFGFAVKATYGEVKVLKEMENVSSNPNKITPASAYIIEPREIFKDPITDDGTKKSKKGLLRVDDKTGKFNSFKEGEGLTVYDQQTPEQEKGGLLETVFLDGKLIKKQSLAEIRERLANQ